ncbi:hypothetical protein [Pyxidicoccus caerfyrddinensis]|uniref:hypothetical protein n=1 Tax=Pyxidicoccus caerfyrddinensis TaxID=2709663 RepID=UPI0013DC765A|nr:hypothetical protein [Pyxidicoccus caerfyrddinensis]
MALDAVFERFVHHSPLPVMARLLMQRALSPKWLDGVFEEHRQRQYTRELLFSTEVDRWRWWPWACGRRCMRQPRPATR